MPTIQNAYPVQTKPVLATDPQIACRITGLSAGVIIDLAQQSGDLVEFKANITLAAVTYGRKAQCDGACYTIAQQILAMMSAGSVCLPKKAAH